MQIPLLLSFLNGYHTFTVRGLVGISFPFSFQLFSCVGSVFAKQFDYFDMLFFKCQIQRSPPLHSRCIDICFFLNK